MLGVCSGKLNFSIVPMDNFIKVIGIEFFHQVHANNQLPNHIDGSVACKVPIKCSKTVEKTLSAYNSRRLSLGTQLFGLYLRDERGRRS